MNQKSIEHIALYSLVLVGTLVVGVLARQFVLSKGVDDFSSSVAFFATVIVLMAIYASLQTTFNQFLLSRIETFLLRFSAFQTMKNHNDTVSVPEVPTSKDSNQTTSDIIESAPTAEETISKPSEYEVLRTNSIAKKNRAIQTKLEKVISYTKQTMVAYMSEEDLNRLCAYITEYSTGDTLQKISPVRWTLNLKVLILCTLVGILVRLLAESVFILLSLSKRSLPMPFVTWKFRLLSVKCHIQNLNVKLY